MRQPIRYVGDSSPTPPLLYFCCPLPQCLLWPQTLELLAEEAKVVYHLLGKTSWSKVAVNGTHQDAEWTFPWDVRVPFPRKSPPRRLQAERPGTSRKRKWNAHFRSDIPVGNVGLPLKTNCLFRKFSGRANQNSLSIYITTEISGFFL